MAGILRQAVRTDVRDIQRVRHSVRENRLTSRVISDEEIAVSIERTGKGWVVELDGRIIGFAIGNAETGNIYALFSTPVPRASTRSLAGEILFERDAP